MTRGLLGKAASLICLLSTFIHRTEAWPQMILSDSVCSEFHVAHGSRSHNIISSAVSVNLLDVNGSAVDCIQPRTSYKLEVRSTTARTIKGLLLMQVFGPGELAKGKFPDGRLPENTIGGVCNRSVSHRCRKATGCSLGESLLIGYTSPNKPKTDVVFRYTVVFSKTEHVGDMRRVFPVCSSLPTTSPTTTATTTPTAAPDCQTSQQQEPHENNLTQEICTNFTVKKGAEKKSGHCGRMSFDSNETHIHTDPETNVNYTCYTNVTVRNTKCVPTCYDEKKNIQWCCRVSTVRYRSRTFTCRADSKLNSEGTPETVKIEVFKRKQTKGCECFPCSEITCVNNCPPSTNPGYNSTNSEYNSTNPEYNSTNLEHNSTNPEHNINATLH